MGEVVIAKSGTVGAVTVNDTVAVCVFPPPVPVTVTEYVPVGVVDAVVIVKVDDPEPGAAIEAGLKPAEAPLGSPLALSDTALLKPPDTLVVSVDVPEAP